MDHSHSDSLDAALAEWRERLHEPWLVAAWPGMGAVARLAVTHLVRQLKAQAIGELALDGSGELPAIEVERGLILPPRLPINSLSGWKHPAGGRDLVLFESDAQPRHGPYRFGQEVVGAARALGVVRVCTFAAMATLIEPDAKPRVFAAASAPSVLDHAVRHGAVPLADGSIGGLNGVLVEIAARRGLGGLCLLGEMPYYASSIGNPKAAVAVLRLFARVAGIEIDLAELESQAAVVEAQLIEFRQRVREMAERPEATARRAGEAVDLPVATGGASEARRNERIETLFAAAKRDRAKALELKAELDRQGRFAEFEDRFLDLFKRAD